MNLKKIPSCIPVYGDVDYRGPSPKEDFESANFFNWVVYQHKKYRFLITHVKNEGKRTWGQVRMDKVIGLTKGFADFVVIGNPTLLLEMKRTNHTKSSTTDEQIQHLLAEHEEGAIACYALGFEAAKQAFNDWLELQQ